MRKNYSACGRTTFLKSEKGSANAEPLFNMLILFFCLLQILVNNMMTLKEL